MKHLKLYEEIIGDPQIGDYVYAKDDTMRSGAVFDIRKKLDTFLNNNIGKIIDGDNSMEYPYYVQYVNIPDNIKMYFEERNVRHITLSNCRTFDEQEIIFFSKNKEDVETYIESIKYNL